MVIINCIFNYCSQYKLLNDFSILDIIIIKLLINVLIMLNLNYCTLLVQYYLVCCSKIVYSLVVSNYLVTNEFIKHH